MKVVLLSILVLTVIGFTEIQAQEDVVEIPSWVKGVANFWVEDKINDNEFAKALEFLIDSDIIQLGNTIIVSESEVQEDPLKMALPEESEMITNLNKQIKKLQVDNDKVEESKDILEEEFMKKESETQAYYEKIIEDMRLQFTDNSDEKILALIEETDAIRDRDADSYRELSAKYDSLWSEYQRLYTSISEVRDNTNPDDFK